MAAALIESLLVNHASVGGNERVAFFATDVFLRLSGWKLDDDDTAHTFLNALLESRAADDDRLLPRIRAHLVRR